MVRLTLEVTSEVGKLRLATPRRGRGASVHPRAKCVEVALRPGVLARAFKQPVDMSSGTAELLRQLTAVSRNQGTS
jgi:predicted RNA-binding protein YlxR (DUF448 family)